MLHHAETDLIRLSTTDPLTGLANRRQLEGALKAWSSTSERSPAALLFIDLDRFKTVNDSLGHAAGDELLVQVAQRIRTASPAESLVARLGGDEFVVLVTGDVSRTPQDIAAAVLRSFEAPFDVLGRPHYASRSVGIAFSEADGDNLLREADAAMYASKRQGGGQAAVFESGLHEAALKSLRIEQDLFLALHREEFLLNYQPIVDLSDGSLRGFEALVRWRHPERGWVSPADFIPLAEESGLIVELGRWVMRTAIAERARWTDSS
ncbi:putative bifunctional diguanylate cyclase/phosphodiesterase [Methylobacterium iners]|uniref:Signaling protein n=1 Tax=Methylobacterium iners TaxID=418707 RepID=A0ABQ4RUX5_9HYPH|nr:diguanylate cyclase [Methylobacterium iners]GJD93483.1 putative signaling protein [Methylobacterium iners]